MSTKLFFQLQNDLEPALRAGNLAVCEQTVAQALSRLPPSPFHCLLDLSIANSPIEVAAHFDGFFRQEAARFEIAAAYTEMNGFDINPDRWYCDVFAYKKYGGHDDHDWISDWQSDGYGELTITGLERLQEVYVSDAFGSEEFSDASYVAGLLVVVKFQDLIRRAAPHLHQLRFPLLATAHEYDFIYEVRRDT